jgi:Tannase and feruloyl esterase
VFHIKVLIRDALIKKCDAKDGVADGLISDPLGCDFDPETLACQSEKNDSCLAPEKAAAIKKAMGGPKTATGTQVYAGFLYDTGITNGPPFRYPKHAQYKGQGDTEDAANFECR